MKFRRQHGIGRYVVDFYCPDARIAIELDGSVHGSVKQTAKDRRKQCYIEGLGIAILRFYNEDVMKNMEGGLKAIRDAKTNHPLIPSLDKEGN